MSVVFTITADAKVLKHKICRTVICSDLRLCYEEAQDILDGKTPASATYPPQITTALTTLNKMALIMRQQRIAAGALTIEQDEPHFELDDNHHPIRIFFTQSGESHHLIEEWMLLANRTVAEQVSRTGKEMVYRVHDTPDPEKLEALNTFRKRMGERVPQTTLDLLSIRAMAKAVYSTNNIGHYGLAFDYYTHFTSPIRRYPDLMVHRIVAKYILGERGQKDITTADDLQEACDHCSDMEQYATQAERDSIKEMQALWISDHIGEVFCGTIVNVTDFGLFVTLDENRCDGLVPIRTIRKGEYLEYDEKNYCLRVVPRKNRRRHSHYAGDDGSFEGQGQIAYTLGDKVQVRVEGSNPELGQINFSLYDENDDTEI